MNCKWMFEFYVNLYEVHNSKNEIWTKNRNLLFVFILAVLHMI